MKLLLGLEHIFLVIKVALFQRSIGWALIMEGLNTSVYVIHNTFLP